VTPGVMPALPVWHSWRGGRPSSLHAGVLAAHGHDRVSLATPIRSVVRLRADGRRARRGATARRPRSLAQERSLRALPGIDLRRDSSARAEI
jgi:hypothetical protein